MAAARWAPVAMKGLAALLLVAGLARPQKLTATLVSQKLVMRDLAGFVGADRALFAKLGLATGG